jgi:hypothetical protein
LASTADSLFPLGQAVAVDERGGIDAASADGVKEEVKDRIPFGRPLTPASMLRVLRPW